MFKTHLKRRKVSNNLNLQQQELEKEHKPKASTRKKIIKIKTEINKIKNRKTIGSQNQEFVLQKFNRINKALAR